MTVGTTGAAPVAVIGIGCRLPGDVTSPADYWTLMTGGADASGEVPGERWSDYADLGPEYRTALRQAVTKGNFLPHIDRFDAAFFGIPPREAATMDPQHRLVLEVAWEALEHAGVPAGSLAGTDAGVFVGVCTADYGGQILEDLPSIEALTGIGAATCAVANRLSHVLDLRGPSIAIDTACSASLVAVHLACQSLRLGESSIAFAGGVNVLVSPGQTLTLGAAGALSPDGRSKSFSAAADGYGRGEGCGVVLLKLLADAERDGDPILAVVRGSAVNQDGRTNGIMAPCGTAQEHVMVRACASAGLDPATVDYVEAHGTGTPVGDPMEAAALAAVYGADRPADEPCLVGSVKANIGHLEGAAGIAGVIKAVLALDRAEVPGTRLEGPPNPAIAWDGSGLDLVTETTPWPERDHPRRAGVSGFGYGGTVAHIVLEQAPPRPAATVPADPAGRRLYPLSAASAESLRTAAAALADRLDAADPPPLASLGHTLALRREHLAERAVVAADGRTELVARLRALADGTPEGGVVTGRRAPHRGRGLVWVFSGHGSQWVGMGREMLDEPAFAQVIDELDPIYREEIGFSPRQVLLDGDLGEVDRVQTMIFAMQTGLAALWRTVGVVPDAVIGHSVGEIGAAVAAGALSLADGGRLICRRSRLLREVAGKGGMVMVPLSFAATEERLAGRTDVAAAIAASPASTVVAGDADAVRALREEWTAEGLRVLEVASDVAFHSPHMDPLLDRLTSAAAGLEHRPTTVPMYSTSLPDPRATPATGGAYWAGNLRNPVRLVDAVTAAAEDGHLEFLEVSPHPVVAHSINETLGELDLDDAFVGTTLRRNRPEQATLQNALAALHCRGIEVDWTVLQSDGGLVGLPGYPWQETVHWYQRSVPARGVGGGHDVDRHTVLGARESIAGSAVQVWRTVLNDDNRPYPGSHALNGVEIVPAAVLTETFREVTGGGVLVDVEMRQPLLTASPREVQVVLDGTELRLASRPVTGPGEDEPPWLIHATATADAGPAELADRLADPGEHRLLPADPALIHRRLAEVGVPSTGFDWTATDLLYGVGMAQATVHSTQTGTWAAAMDAVMSIAPAAFSGAPELRMVVHIDDIVVTGEPPETFTVEVALDDTAEDTVNALVADADGVVVARLSGLRYPVIDPPEETAVESGEEQQRSFAGIPPEELRALVLEEVAGQIATEMGLALADLNHRRPLLDQGLDSVMTVAIRRRLEKRFGTRLAATVFWERPTVTAIAEHLVELLAPEES
ncbi:type I polyketide synthase [Actinomadura rayongensis]|uniref:Acyltransferase domain-containing protein n=1 Tax=Actinomadura rayongensis TaxID=1429076 RepID=A0A6I4VXE2_9ACTN|nr:type I polyketide synthase [Actinomadura rayongensis]MXQ63029.1 acyltransferase domain-containing protein [Actinomadura rayongensis]